VPAISIRCWRPYDDRPRAAVGCVPGDVTVSREHAVVEQRDDGVHIVDLSSLNGTYVNRERVEDALLSDGDELQVGKYRLTFIER